MVSERGVATRRPADPVPTQGGLPVPTRAAVEDVKRSMDLFQELVTTLLVEERDYGGLPGLQGKVLLDSGANLVMNAYDLYPGERRVMRMDIADGRISVVLEVPLVSRKTGQVVSTGVGAGSTLETKHRWRWVNKPAEWGHGVEEIAKMKTRSGEGWKQWRIPNQETDDLLNTIFKMCSKRGEVDAVGALPGVPAALKKLYGEGGAPAQDRQTQGKKRTPASEAQDRWTRFWPETVRLGYTQEQVRARFGVKKMEEWEAQGHTLEEALAVLRAETPPAAAEPAQGSRVVDTTARPAGAATPTDLPITGEQSRMLVDIAAQGGWQAGDITAFLQGRMGVEMSKDLTRETAVTFIGFLSQLNAVLKEAREKYGTEPRGFCEVLGIKALWEIQEPLEAMSSFRERMQVAPEGEGRPPEGPGAPFED